MAKAVLRIYIPRKAKAEVRSWRHFGRKKALGRYLLEKAQEAAIGEAELSQVVAGYLAGDPEHPAKRVSEIPDCLDICGRQEDLRAFCELYRTQLATSTIVWLTLEQFATSPRWLAKVINAHMTRRGAMRCPGI
jgi:hypothetical protein